MSQAIATFAGGCFWCIESAFIQLKGVSQAISGYSGGQSESASYKDVCSGSSGHAEVVQLHYDPQQISYNSLLKVFFHLHDPTQLNRQGADVGTQYRSAVFFHDQEQYIAAERYIQQINQEGLFDAPLQTSLEPMNAFYSAEDYHQGYFAKNSEQAYCSLEIAPKLQKFKTQFKALLKD